ncbi:RsmB/NOP family class I SAM-dependent RNA methyltransferase [Roseovarius aestuarii]|uniref:Ribosomal RNA small subunit methyltransferase B n=1 Tax=Roseovarius aestuarii TaxID=475083 RepID=A0A1X7BZC6_9RHOB|nr:RsmB/NOP family class I SAM-dependent RNA methyltransferase [Roseovarius aestuarii]SMC14639.1 Ribosomal RNA small subunit methyltransferase B [Roseovarius aestuarii]
MNTPHYTARRSAVYLLDQVLGEGRLMSDLIASGKLDRLPPADRARAQRLANDTLRGLDRADRLLNRQLRKPPALHVHNILRLGTVELCMGGDAHGVVHELVGLMGNDRRHAKLKGLVNAVLRKMAGDAGKPWKDLRLPRLPGWLREPLVSAWGANPVNMMEKAHFAGAPLDITVKAGAERWAEMLGGRLLPTGSIRLDDVGQVSALAGFATGDWWVQDAAAALPVSILAPKPGEKIVDLCAAPGGKTLQLAAAGAEVTAVDLSERRMARVAENLKRTGLEAACVTGDVLEHEGSYDALLLDAPCSATGTIRRHPDLPYAKDGSDFGELIALQARMIDHAVGLLKPGGRLVYCTCSLLPDEGECQVEEALVRHDGLYTDRDALAVPGADPAWITEEGGLRLRPDYWADQGGMDGFYIACLRR